MFKIKTISIALVACLASSSVFADLIPTGNSNFYYQIGGGNIIPLPIAPSSQAINLGVDGNVGLGYNCGVFDPQMSIVNSLNSAQASFENMLSNVISSATGALEELPAYELAKAEPSLYQMLQDGVSNGQWDFGVSTKSCQQMASQIASGQNPYNNWLQASLGDDWKYHMSLASLAAKNPNSTLGDASSDINQVNTAVNKDNGSNGVEWVQGVNQGGAMFAGGNNQPPILLITDTSIAGYNVLVGEGRNYNDKSAPSPNDSNRRITSTWPDPVTAAAWITQVVGDQEITTYTGGPKDMQPGTGLLGDVQTLSSTLTQQIADLVTGAQSLTLQNLEAVSAPRVLINSAVIQTIQKENDPVLQSIIVSKLAQEVAVAKTLDQAELAKQILMVGGQAPAIYENNAAQAGVNAAIQRLKTDMDDLVFDNQVNNQFVSKTLNQLMTDVQDQENQSVSIRPSAVTPPSMEGGAIPTNGGQ